MRQVPKIGLQTGLPKIGRYACLTESTRSHTPGSLWSQHSRTLTPEFLGGRVPNTTFLRRGRDWPQSVAAHTAPEFLLKLWETCS